VIRMIREKILIRYLLHGKPDQVVCNLNASLLFVIFHNIFIALHAKKLRTVFFFTGQNFTKSSLPGDCLLNIQNCALINQAKSGPFQ